MIQRLKYLLTSFVMSGMILLPVAIPSTVHALSGTSGSLCRGTSLQVSGSGSCDSASSGNSLNNILKWVLDIFSVIVGIAAVIMIVVGGLKYTISGGDSTRVSGAKDTILFAIVGLVVVALAQIIVHFVLSNVGTRAGG